MLNQAHSFHEWQGERALQLRRYQTVPDSLDELRGPEHGIITLPHELAWSGRREFDLDDNHDRTALYRIVLEEGQKEDLRHLLNRALLQHDWPDVIPARQVRTLWERRFPELRHAA